MMIKKMTTLAALAGLAWMTQACGPDPVDHNNRLVEIQWGALDQGERLNREFDSLFWVDGRSELWAAHASPEFAEFKRRHHHAFDSLRELLEAVPDWPEPEHAMKPRLAELLAMLDGSLESYFEPLCRQALEQGRVDAAHDSLYNQSLIQALDAFLAAQAAFAQGHNIELK